MISFPSEDNSIENAEFTDEAADLFVFPASFAQQRLWITEQLHPGYSAYTIPLALRLDGSLDSAALDRSIQTVVARHEALRTTFMLLDGELLQTIAPALTIPLPIDDLSGELLSEAELQSRIAAEIRQPFDLAHGPLLRLRLLRLRATEHVLVLSLHHLIADGWSIGVLIHELAQIYPTARADSSATVEDLGALLPPLPIQYADYALWEREHLTAERLEQSRRYWQQQLAGAPTVLDLPTDRPRPARQTFRGAHYPVALPPELSAKVVAFSQRMGLTTFMTLNTALAAILSRYSGQHELLIGTPVAERTRPETQQLIGLLINTLVLRCDLHGDPTVAQALERMRETCLGAYAHQDLPFKQLVELVEVDRHTSYSPLFQVLFAWQNPPSILPRLGDVAVALLPTESGTAQFDLTLNLGESAAGISGFVEYNSDLFAAPTIERLVRQYETLLQALIADPGQRVSRLPLLTPAEQQQLLVDWNAARLDYPAVGGIHDLVQAQAARTPNAVAVVAGDRSLTYAALNERANRLAHYLLREVTSRNAAQEIRVGIAMEPCLEMIVSMLAILKTGGAYLPLDPAYPAQRLQVMLTDSQAALVLTEERLLERLPATDTPILCLDRDWAQIAAWPASDPGVAISPDQIAYMIYTSGSTGTPKGVLVPHRGIISNLTWREQTWPLSSADRVLLNYSFSFDPSVWNIFWPLSAGAQLVLVPVETRYDSAALVRTMADHQITVFGATPSQLAVLVQEPGISDCTHLRYVVSGGEPLSGEIQQRFFERLNATLCNSYGPTEATIDTTFWLCQPSAEPQAVPIGRPIPNVQVYVLDRHLQPAPVGVPGEIYIGGVSVARGYHRRPGLTAETFIPDPFSQMPGARLYKTGDLARYHADGNLEFLGRVDDQVKVRGFRIELGEIEALLRQHRAVQDALVLVRDDRLVAYVVAPGPHPPAPSPTSAGEGETGSSISPPSPAAAGEGDVRRTGGEGLRAFLSSRLPNYMIPAAFVLLEALPLTPSGKIDRRALPAPDGQRPDLEAAFVEPRSHTERVLAAIWQELLQVEQVGAYDNFFDLGGHSLLVMQVVSRIRDALGVEIPLRSLFETPTIAGIAQMIDQAAQESQQPALPPIERVARSGPLPLSFAQERLWFIEQLDATASPYIMSTVLRLRGALDIAALEQSLNLIVQRHESLRTTFAVSENGPAQVIVPELPVPLRLIDLPQDSTPEELEQQIAAELSAPFDLIVGPLLRLTLLRLAKHEHMLVLALHHIIADGWSLTIFVRELAALYTGHVQKDDSSLPPLPIQYADFAAWQRSTIHAAVHAAQIDYWWQQLAAAPPLELPLDYPRPPLQTFRGIQLPVRIDPITTGGLHALSQRHGASLFMTLLAAFNVLLHRYSGQTDILVGTPVANRRQRETESLIGLLLNMLVLRTDLSGDPGVEELLARVREMCLQAYARQDVPFEQVVEAVQPERDLSRNPLFQVAFFWQNVPFAMPALADVQIEPMAVAANTAQFELTLNLGESADCIQGFVEYNSDLFAAPTIERMIEQFVLLLQAIVADPSQRVSRLPLLTTAEQRLLHSWNETALPVPESCIHTLIAGQVARTPDAIALVHEADALSYAELFERAKRLAKLLRARGIGPDMRVGICLPRTPDLVVALLATLQAGGCYVPLDPEYPQERLEFMLRDAQIALVLTTTALEALLGPTSAQVVCLDAADQPTQTTEHAPASPVTPDNLAYAIYTSGSTGQPKGVMVTHRNVVNFFAGMDQRIGADSPGTWLALTSVSFDISVLELLWTLARGFKVVLQDERQALRGDSPARSLATRPIDFSLFYFASANHADGDIYRLLLEGAQFADQHGFTAVWTPERHFHTFGGLYPSPSVMSAALATLTRRIQIRAGSVVLPLHSPIRVAEEWSIVDNLSRGRIGISFASGWHAHDFVFAPDRYANRKQAMLESIETVRKLWRGETLPFQGGAGDQVPIRILPRPIQPELPIWLTGAGNPETFRLAGEIGASLLTHLLGQSIEELAEKIAIYRRAWREAGHPGNGHVTLMIHTFVSDDLAAVRSIVREPFRSYLRDSLDLLEQLAQSLGLDMRAEQFSAADMEYLLDQAFERYFETSGLFGTPESCMAQINLLKASGIDEVACLIDFGVETDTVLQSLHWLDELRQRSNPAPEAIQIDYSLPAQLARHQVTHLQCTPSHARMLLSDQDDLAAWQSVRMLLVGGEAMPVDLARDLRSQISADLYNLYGPTETTIWSAAHHVKTIETSVPLGRPIANTQIYILDKRMQQVPIGAAGEIYIGGAGVARGYLNRPELTAERFLPDPFGTTGHPQGGARLYKTGDLARHKADGTIEFLGRSDQQVKLRGYRIEPGEIESALLEHPAIQQAAVIARTDEAAQARLIAYVVPSEPEILPLTPVLSPEEQARLLNGRATYTLPNGMPVVHFSDLQAAVGYREVIEDAIYLKYGIQLPPGACVFDVGANVGYFSLFASQRRRDISIYAFEPIPPTFAALQLNVALYGLNVRAFPVGLAARRETVTFTFYPAMPGLSGRYADLAHDKLATKAIILNDRGYTSASQGDPTLGEAELDEMLELQFRSESYTCEVRTLSEMIQECGVRTIDLLKIDVERAEVDVLRGLSEDDWTKIKQVVLEVDTRENLDQVIALLEQHDFYVKVDDFVIIPPADQQPGVYIYMVYASRSPLQAEGERQVPAPLAVSELREFLATRLPEYMIPAAFVPLSALPLTPNGKLDRKALPEPGAHRPELAVNYVAPHNEIQQRIAAVWRELLQVDNVGIYDNFFELGGTSLLLVQARTKLRAALDRDVSLVELFQYPTISALAQHLSVPPTQQPAASAALDQVRQNAERQKQIRQQKRSMRRSTS